MSNLILISWHLIIIAAVGVLITQAIMQSTVAVATSDNNTSHSNYSVKLINLTNWIPPSSSDVNNSLAFVDSSSSSSSSASSYRLVSKLNNYTECLTKAFELFWTEATAFDDILNEIIRKIDAIYLNSQNHSSIGVEMNDDGVTKIFTQIVFNYRQTLVQEINKLKISFEEYYDGILASSITSYRKMNDILIEFTKQMMQKIIEIEDFDNFEAVNNVIVRYIEFLIGIENKTLRQALFLSNTRRTLNVQVQNISRRFDEYFDRLSTSCLNNGSLNNNNNSSSSSSSSSSLEQNEDEFDENCYDFLITSSHNFSIFIEDEGDHAAATAVATTDTHKQKDDDTLLKFIKEFQARKQYFISFVQQHTNHSINIIFSAMNQFYDSSNKHTHNNNYDEKKEEIEKQQTNSPAACSYTFATSTSCFLVIFPIILQHKLYGLLLHLLLILICK